MRDEEVDVRVMEEVVGIMEAASEGLGRATLAGPGGDVLRLPSRVAVREPHLGATAPRPRR